jgi:hypothetical protein
MPMAIRDRIRLKVFIVDPNPDKPKKIYR